MILARLAPGKHQNRFFLVLKQGRAGGFQINSLSAFADHKAWQGSLIHAALKIAVLFAIGRMLQRKPTANSNGTLHISILPLVFVLLFTWGRLANALSAFVFYLFFVGLGEELLFRGYIQSRLNIAFGRPFTFFGVSYGWGIVMASALFGLMHVLNTGSLVAGSWELAWWWGFWTFFGGLVLGFVREKTGSIIAPALLHGLPQALAYAVMGW